MPWVKIDDHFPDHWKLAELSGWLPFCGWLYVCGLAFCNRQLTDGRIPKTHVRSGRLASFEYCELSGKPVDPEAVALELVAVGLWEQDEDNYYVHDYADYQPTRAEAEALRRERQAAGKKGADARWQTDSKQNGNGDSNGHGKPMASECPVPVPDPDPQDVHTEQARDAAEERFAEFWRVYPKKVGKDAARRAFRKRKVSDALLTIMLSAVALQRLSEQWRRDGGKYIPNPATWLNQGRWEDEVIADPTLARKVGPDYGRHWYDDCHHEPKCDTLSEHQVKSAKEAA